MGMERCHEEEESSSDYGNDDPRQRKENADTMKNVVHGSLKGVESLDSIHGL
jgi:hypothetical protein